jgi:hypothetical protein
MSDNLKYHVLPHDPKLQPTVYISAIPLTDGEKKYVDGLGGGFGCFLWGGMFMLIAALSGSGLAGFVVASIAIALIAMVIKSNNVATLEQKKAGEAMQSVVSANQSEARRVKDEAASLTSSLMRTYDSSTKLATELTQYLNQASHWLREAQIEYKDNAFSPFWDAVENAAVQLSAFNDKANQLSQNAKDYYGKLNGRKHTFPTFPVSIETLPDTSSVVNELRRIVRMGQTNFQFANIWEHRRTREVLIAGFRTLGEAINNLGATLEYSVSNLQQSVSSGLARSVEEEINTRKAFEKRMLEQNRMLDNIQHRRKPKTTDRPSGY